jgi:epoxyqueuosine reductase
MTEQSSLGADLEAHLSHYGLNVFGVADPALYDSRVAEHLRCASLMEGVRSIVVIGSGGPSLWNAFVQHLTEEPRALTEERHPLDAFVMRVIEEADSALGGRWFFAAADQEVNLDFRLLGALAGLGRRSRMGLLLNDRYGLWLGLRAACFSDVALTPSAIDTSDPCADCPGYCATACPGGAFPRGTWEVERCASFHAESELCASSCEARFSCPKGQEARYPPEAIAYHYNREAGRKMLRERIGISTLIDRHRGQGPSWSAWVRTARGEEVT